MQFISNLSQPVCVRQCRPDNDVKEIRAEKLWVTYKFYYSFVVVYPAVFFHPALLSSPTILQRIPRMAFQRVYVEMHCVDEN